MGFNLSKPANSGSSSNVDKGENLESLFSSLKNGDFLTPEDNKRLKKINDDVENQSKRNLTADETSLIEKIISHANVSLLIRKMSGASDEIPVIDIGTSFSVAYISFIVMSLTKQIKVTMDGLTTIGKLDALLCLFDFGIEKLHFVFPKNPSNAMLLNKLYKHLIEAKNGLVRSNNNKSLMDHILFLCTKDSSERLVNKVTITSRMDGNEGFVIELKVGAEAHETGNAAVSAYYADNTSSARDPGVFTANRLQKWAVFMLPSDMRPDMLSVNDLDIAIHLMEQDPNQRVMWKNKPTAKTVITTNLHYINEGSYGIVFKDENKGTALKFFCEHSLSYDLPNITRNSRRMWESKRSIIDEVYTLSVLSKISHSGEYIVKMISAMSFFSDSTLQNMFCIEMDLYDGNIDRVEDITRKKVKRAMTVDEKYELTKKLLLAFKWLHSVNTVHGDVKGGNILFKYQEVNGKLVVDPKISDFGFSIMTNPNIVNKTVTVRFYSSTHEPPEVKMMLTLAHLYINDLYTENGPPVISGGGNNLMFKNRYAGDVYALGVTLCRLWGIDFHANMVPGNLYVNPYPSSAYTEHFKWITDNMYSLILNDPNQDSVATRKSYMEHMLHYKLGQDVYNKDPMDLLLDEIQPPCDALKVGRDYTNNPKVFIVEEAIRNMILFDFSLRWSMNKVWEFLDGNKCNHFPEMKDWKNIKMRDRYPSGVNFAISALKRGEMIARSSITASLVNNIVDVHGYLIDSQGNNILAKDTPTVKIGEGLTNEGNNFINGLLAGFGDSIGEDDDDDDDDE